jgi:hypothetical protein
MLAPLTPPHDAFPRPAVDSRLVRFLWGFSLPFQIAGWVRRRAPEEWRVWRRVALVQGLVTLMCFAAIVAATLVIRSVFVAWVTSLDEDVKVQGFDDWKATAFTIVALLAGIEWLVIAFSREHHEQITRAITERFALPPEDPLQTPRIRLSLRWLWRRIRRWGRGVKAIVGVMPFILAVSLLVSPLGLSDRVSKILLLLWSFYWGAVIACSKTAYAWRTEGDASAPEPRYVHRLRRWPIVSLLGRFLGRMTRTSAPAVREVDAQPWEFLGLAAARLLLGLPVVYAFIRPTLPVASLLVLATPVPEPELLASPSAPEAPRSPVA